MIAPKPSKHKPPTPNVASSQKECYILNTSQEQVKHKSRRKTMNKTAASTLADNIVAQFKYEFTANGVNDVAIPEDSILKEAALRTISREIADGFIREKALNELKERDERSYRRFAKYVRYPECPVVPGNFKIEEGDGSALYYPTFTVEECMEIMLQHAYRNWINERTDRSEARKKSPKF